MFKTYYIIFFLLSSCLVSFGQLKKGDNYVSKNMYVEAIKCYKKAVNTKNSNLKQEALLKLANAYKTINEYQKAESSFQQALAIGTVSNVEEYYNYAQVLKVNNKYEEASENYQIFLKSNPKHANAKNALKFCREIKYYTSKPIEYVIKNIESLNTERSEFSPIYFSNRLYFVAEKTEFNFVDFSNNDLNGEPYLNMFTAEIKNDQIKKTKQLSKKINTDYHDGPACISSDGKTLYFTRTNNKLKDKYVNHAKIYIATGSGSKWTNIASFQFNNDEYSVAHPSISSDGNYLFFTSNMPGGFGGKDIYFCKKEANGWSNPKNLGPDINTTGDEMFPCIKSNGVLYFSSNGLPGFGGLDIYSAKQSNGVWIVIRNEGLNLNSSYDDFGITFQNDSVGYFSSNRQGGKGKDDIYKFAFKDKSMILGGAILLTENLNNPAKNIHLKLLDEKGQFLDSTKTNSNGGFEFKNLEADKKYMMYVDETDPLFAGKAHYYYADKSGVIQRISNKGYNQKFLFKNLPADPSALPDLFAEDDLTLAGNLLYGENPSKAIKNTKIKLVNDYGDVIEETTTNEFGAFAFRNIPADQNYLFTIEESDITLPENTKITLTNKSGKVLKTFYKGKDKFTFKVISSDKTMLSEMDVNDEDLIMDVFGYVYDQNKKPIAFTKVKLLAENDPAVYELKTSESGKFNFRNLKADKNYIFEADETDPALKNVTRIFIADAKGKIYKVIDKNMDGKFKFKIMESDKQRLGEFVVDDPWLAVLELKNKQEKELTIIENIYYASGDHKLDDAGIKIMDKVISVMQSNKQLIVELSSHTDSKASDQFNLVLSKKRAQTAVDYLIAKGIDKKRLTAVGYGETKLLNKCTNNVECTDDEHKINRRTEFKINEQKLP
ncbi:MAG: OmpA family protein [Bacteroidetes bacterium]|nr:OmpA family protein [Bacteroidota bacterium]MCA6442931.1 OmpA family protein [Bacteroidota bacterium]